MINLNNFNEYQLTEYENAQDLVGLHGMAWNRTEDEPKRIIMSPAEWIRN